MQAHSALASLGGCANNTEGIQRQIRIDGAQVANDIISASARAPRATAVIGFGHAMVHMKFCVCCVNEIYFYLTDDFHHFSRNCVASSGASALMESAKS